MNFERGIKVETIIIITSLIVLTGFVQIFSNHRNDLPGNYHEEASNLFIIPSVLNNIKQGKLWESFETVYKDESSAHEFEKNDDEFVNEEEINYDFDEQAIMQQYQINKKAIVYKSVTKRMTLVKVY